MPAKSLLMCAPCETPNLFSATAASARSIHGFERECNSLATADAERDDSSFDSIALHRMQESSREHRSARTDGVTMRDRAAFDVDDFGTQSKVLCDRNCDCREGFIDL